MAETIKSADGTTRQAYYGADGEQPWDRARRRGFVTPEVCAFQIIRYLGRRKGDDAHDVESARWYWERLIEMVARGHYRDRRHAEDVLSALTVELTPEEGERLAAARAP